MRSDAAVEASGGEASLQTDWTHRLNSLSLHAASNSLFTLILSHKMKLCCFVNRCRIHLYRTDDQPPSLTPPVKQICHRKSTAENVGDRGREWRLK